MGWRGFMGDGSGSGLGLLRHQRGIGGDQSWAGALLPEHQGQVHLRATQRLGGLVQVDRVDMAGAQDGAQAGLASFGLHFGGYALIVTRNY